MREMLYSFIDMNLFMHSISPLIWMGKRTHVQVFVCFSSETIRAIVSKLGRGLASKMNGRGLYKRSVQPNIAFFPKIATSLVIFDSTIYLVVKTLCHFIILVFVI